MEPVCAHPTGSVPAVVVASASVHPTGSTGESVTRPTGPPARVRRPGRKHLARVGYPVAIVLAVLGLVVQFSEGLGFVGHPTEAALGLINVSFVVTVWQAEHERRHSGENSHGGPRR
ncbi:hypothetical protein PGAAJM_10525 [Kocuria varians]